MHVVKRTEITPKNVVCICVDDLRNELASGRLYHCYAEEPVLFMNQVQLLSEMGNLYDMLNFPQASTRDRTMKARKAQNVIPKEAIPVKEEQEVKNQVGQRASFIVRVSSRQNATWQGSISWTEKGVTKHFRSALELLKLIDSALIEEDNKPKEEEGEKE